MSTDRVNGGVPSLDGNSARNSSAGEVSGGRNKDSSHSRGGSMASKGEVKKKQLQPNPSVSSGRKQELAPAKSVKPLWQTVFQVCLPLLVLTGVVCKWWDMEVRIADLESRMAQKLEVWNADNESRMTQKLEVWNADIESRMTQNLQNQVDAIDKKMRGAETDGRIEKITEEMASLNNRFERTVEIVTSLYMLDARHQLLDKTCGQLNSKDLFAKEDFRRMYQEFRELARQIVEEQIEKHAADGLGRVDYALATDGAMVLKHSKPYSVGGWNWYRKMVPEDMLTPSFGEAGLCYALEGSSGYVVIKLREAIIPEAVTLEHVAKSVKNDRSDAPRDCRVFGWLQATQQGARSIYADTESSSVDGNYTLLTEFTYDLDKSNVQTYHVLDSANSAIIDTIRFEFTSNHGSPSHTCIYRIRMHGSESDWIPPVPVHHDSPSEELELKVLGWFFVFSALLSAFIVWWNWDASSEFVQALQALQNLP